MLKDFKNIKAIILDLDDTLYDCSGTLLLQGRRQAAKNIAKIINCSEEEAYNLQLEIEKKYGTRVNIYEKIVSLYNLPNSYIKELLEEFIHTDVSGISLFPDVKDTLIQLMVLGYKVILVTSGEKEIQDKKIHVLGLSRGCFDDIFVAGRNNGQIKKDCFQEIMRRYNLKPEEIVCVGDKIDDELTASKSLGMTTVMIEHGRHYELYVREPHIYIKPDYFIKHIKDILELRIGNYSQIT